MWAKNLVNVSASRQVAMNSHKWSLTSGCNSSPHHQTSTIKCSGLTERLRNESFIYSPEYAFSPILTFQKKLGFIGKHVVIPYLTRPK
ncbi:hypothetical protein ElyMa_006697800 [Elysia marginata]|uniref:Uncharacterized protein n=1 Tax=Elysia marginata TaxID=1093978 RepID=A0AAV4ITU3_9GAST|nr:hypothetical protein ElyMa_006697800 [Elysia marginata]